MSEQTNKEDINSSTVRQRLAGWFRQYPGKLLLDMELHALSQILPNLFGYHFIQIGNMIEGGLFSSSRISHRAIVHLQDDGTADAKEAKLIGSESSLPIVSDSIDVVLVPHTLEYSDNPHKLLREIERILIGDGHLVLLGFNPWSLYGLWRLGLAWREEPPWCGHFYGLARVKDWLSLLDFDIVRLQRFFYRPPLRNKNLMKKFSFQEKLGKHCWPYFGGVYLIVAKKRVIPLTPTRLRWHSKRRMIASGVAEPSARSRH